MGTQDCVVLRVRLKSSNQETEMLEPGAGPLRASQCNMNTTEYGWEQAL